MISYSDVDGTDISGRRDLIMCGSSGSPVLSSDDWMEYTRVFFPCFCIFKAYLPVVGEYLLNTCNTNELAIVIYYEFEDDARLFDVILFSKTSTAVCQKSKVCIIKQVSFLSFKRN